MKESYLYWGEKKTEVSVQNREGRKEGLVLFTITFNARSQQRCDFGHSFYRILKRLEECPQDTAFPPSRITAALLEVSLNVDFVCIWLQILGSSGFLQL